MDKVIIEKTSSSPEAVLDPDQGTALLKGHSFPENTFSFYKPIIDWISSFLKDYELPFVLRCELLYFNTSTAKLLFNLFELLEKSKISGRDVKIQWFYHPENDVALQCGQEFSEDIHSVPFEILENTDLEN
ncbi:DUF1987 domain-containing protein [Spirochaeta dissipatitropha]